MREEEDKGEEKAGNIWQLFVRLIQAIWKTGTISCQVLWMVVVLLPKGGGYYQGISLLEPFWKVIEVLFHDCLHGFLGGRGTGMAITEVKLTHQFAYLEQVLLYGIFIDLR